MVHLLHRLYGVDAPAVWYGHHSSFLVLRRLVELRNPNRKGPVTQMDLETQFTQFSA